MIKTAMKKIVIGGAGLSGAMSAALLRKYLPGDVKFKILEKSRGTGGRMTTRRSTRVKSTSVDLGAQYISVNLHYAKKHQSVHEELIAHQLLQPLTCVVEGAQHDHDVINYVAPQGVDSLVKYFIQQADAEVALEEHISRVDTEGGMVKVTTLKGDVDVCDGIILTMPVPQILQLDGSVRQLIDSQPDVKESLERVSYSMRFAVGLFYDPGTVLDYPWAAKYIDGNPCVRYVAIDNKKRGCDEHDVGPSVVVHTSVPFGIQHIEEDIEDVKPMVMEHVREVLPLLPQPAEVIGHKWRYSQVHQSYSGQPGCVLLSRTPLIILAGDAFSHSNLDGCLNSAQAVRDVFVNLKIKL